jgi:hypothetical protein
VGSLVCSSVIDQPGRNGRKLAGTERFGRLNVGNCLECGRYQLEIQNLEQGLQLAKQEARATGNERPMKVETTERFSLMLRLAYRLDEARKNYARHRNAHSVLN